MFLKIKYFGLLSCFVLINCSYINSQNIDTVHQKTKTKFIAYAGMGLGYTSTPSFNDYLRSVVAGGVYDSVKSFSVGLEIFGGIDYRISKDLSVGLDYSYFIKGGTYNYATYYPLDYSLHIHQPFIMVSYGIYKPFYSFKIGAGIGYQFAQLSNTFSYNSVFNYSASGFALKADAVFSNQLSTSLNTYIGIFVNGSFIGVLKDSGGNPLKNSLTNQNVNLTGFGIGVRVGFTINIL